MRFQFNLRVTATAILLTALPLYLSIDKTSKSRGADLPHMGSSRDVPSDIPNVPQEFTVVRKAAETQAIRITAEMPRIVSLGKPIVVGLQLINNRHEFIDCNHDVDSRDFDMTLTDLKGHRVALTEFGKQNEGCPYTFSLNPGLRLTPGQHLDRRYDLMKYFQISEPGSYKLRILKAVESTQSFPQGGSELEVEIESLVFTATR